MLFIRTAIVIGAGIMFLPTDEKSQARFMETAATAMTQVMTTCERHPAVCDKAGAAWGVFKQKAEFGGRVAMDLIKERAFGVASEKPSPASVVTPQQRGTLTGKDLEPAWRGGKIQRTGA